MVTSAARRKEQEIEIQTVVPERVLHGSKLFAWDVDEAEGTSSKPGDERSEFQLEPVQTNKELLALGINPEREAAINRFGPWSPQQSMHLMLGVSPAASCSRFLDVSCF